ncbi:MAG: amidohydrolase family protein, partial [Chromatiales bacterium]|nr:amidohydrolase family protein [Chromatiales bacterium]
MKRRTALATLGVLGLGGWWAARRHWPDDAWRNRCAGVPLPPHLREHPLLRAAWNGIAPERVRDMHVHLIGNGLGGHGTYVNPAMRGGLNPLKRAQFAFYLNAACVTDDAGAEDQYAANLARMADDLPRGTKLMLFAFDWFCDESGEPDPARSTLHVPNAYARQVAARRPDRFEWVASIHPYRLDAIERLQAAIDGGARAIKWLPPAMGIDPASAQCDAFYELLAASGLPLISHAGDEHAVDAGDLQALGNPLRLRRALDRGVRVIVAHCGSQGVGEDIDRFRGGGRLANFELFARLMEEPNYVGRVFGDISAMPQINRFDPWLMRILER